MQTWHHHLALLTTVGSRGQNMKVASYLVSGDWADKHRENKSLLSY